MRNKMKRFISAVLTFLLVAQSALPAQAVNQNDDTASAELTYVTGVNLGGDAVTVDGVELLSYTDAQSNGLTVGPHWTDNASSKNVPWKDVSETDADLKNLLDTNVYIPTWNSDWTDGDTITMSQTLENGTYQVYFWMSENYEGGNGRPVNITLEGEVVGENVSPDAAWGSWIKAGPYEATVSDGALDMSLQKVSGDPVCCGFAIYAGEGSVIPDPGVDKSALDAAIATAEAKVEANYTADSWTAMQEALSSAKAVKEKADATQEEVNTATEALKNTIKALVRNDSENPSEQTTIDFTDLASVDYFEIVGQKNAAIEEGVGLKLVATKTGIEPANGQLSGTLAETAEDLVEIPVSGDWTATLEVDFSKNGAANGYYQFFGFYAVGSDEDYQNMAGIRGGDGSMQNFLRQEGTVTADSSDMVSQPGFSAETTYFLRIDKVDTTYTCYRSDDGDEFTEMFSYEDTGIEATRLVIDAYTGMTEGYAFTLKNLELEGVTACEHEYTTKVTEPTCTEAGYTTYTCTKCGKVKTGDKVDALGHTHADDAQGKVVAPTCTESGYTKFACDRCGAEMIENKTPALGHQYGEDGKCTVCGAEKPNKFRVVISTDFPPLDCRYPNGHLPTDHKSDPDDLQSMVRFLLYSDLFDVEGLIATSGTFAGLARKSCILDMIDVYEQDYETLIKNSGKDYPTPDELRAVTYEHVNGTWGGGMEKINENNNTEASNRIIELLKDNDPRPVWVCVWGDSSAVVQAVWELDRQVKAGELSKDEFDRLTGKLRIHQIADQDDMLDQWLLPNFPNIFVIWSKGTYLGICQNNADWVQENIIEGHGALGAAYPDRGMASDGITEGDTPSFLYLVYHALNGTDGEDPTQESWGGQFRRGGDTNHYLDGPGAGSISKWNEITNADFAARLDYLIPEDEPGVTYSNVTVEGSYATTSGAGRYKEGAAVTIDAGSRSGYEFAGWTAEGVTLTDAASAKTTFTMPANAVTVTATWTELEPVDPPEGEVGEFVMGVNFNGNAVVIDGNQWTAQKDAEGFSTTAPSTFTANLTWTPAVDADMTHMLNSCIYAPQKSFTISQELEDGDYAVYLWMSENYQDNARAMNITMEGTQVATEVGQVAKSSWEKVGPYAVTVTDGVLDIGIDFVRGDPNVNGMAIYQLDTEAKIDGWVTMDATKYDSISEDPITKTDTAINYTDAAPWVKYRAVQLHETTNQVTFTAANAGEDATIEVLVGSESVGTFTIGNTGGADVYQDFTFELTQDVSGIKTITLNFVSGTFALKSLVFTQEGETIQRGTITGTVTSDGEAVAGAEVSLNANDVLYTTTTDENGAYTIENVSYGDHKITVVCDGYQTATKNVTLNGASATVDVVLEKDGGTEVPSEFTVTFNTNGGSTIASAKVEEGQKVVKPADPTKSGYTFAGWYSDETLTNAYNFDSAVNGDITLYAKWTENSSSGGGGSSVTRYTITVTQTEGGKITPSTVSVISGISKTFTITPDEGYVIEDVLVDGKSVGAVETYTFENVRSSHTIKAVFTTDIDEGDTPLGDLPFTDVEDSDWFAAAVQYVTEHKLMNGVSSSQFAPNSTMTRAMIVTVLARLEGVDTTAGDTWYEAGQQWAMEKGISDGTNMMGSLTREQLVTMLYRYAGSPAVSGAITGFADTTSVSDWASDAMTWAVQNGIILGNNGNLNPQNDVTRAEVATMLMRFITMD